MATFGASASFGSWLVALAVISVPVVYLQSTGKEDSAWWIVTVVLLGLAIYHVPQLTTATNDIIKSVRG
jgi:hypothetical protein